LVVSKEKLDWANEVVVVVVVVLVVVAVVVLGIRKALAPPRWTKPWLLKKDVLTNKEKTDIENCILSLFAVLGNQFPTLVQERDVSLLSLTNCEVVVVGSSI
jgi:hypothetical protein